MVVYQAFRYELAVTAAQRAVLTNHAGAARWAWNWGLPVRRKAWLYEVSKCAPQEALRDLDRAYANYWRSRRSGRRVMRPRFKKRGRCADRFRLAGGIRVEPVVLPRIGRVATKEPTGKFRGRILSATCSREADRWYVALTVEAERPDPRPAVSRKRPGSRNRRKAVLSLAWCHRRIRNQRTDALHKATTTLAKAKSVIVVEDLHVAVWDARVWLRGMQAGG